MRGAISNEATQEAAAFALLNGVRGISLLPLAPVAEMTLQYRGEVDALGCGWSVCEAISGVLEVAVQGRFALPERVIGVQAELSGNQPGLSVAVDRALPALHLGFGSYDFQPEASGNYLLRYRPVFSSADPWYRQRERSLRHVAHLWNIPCDRSGFGLGVWDAAEGAWEDDTVRRVLALAWLLHAIRPKQG